MKLSELEDGVTVTFELHIADKKFEFPSTLVFRKRGKAYFTPIRVQNKILNVQGENTKVNMVYAVEGDRPIMWLDAPISGEAYKKEVFYTIDLESVGKRVNRRGAYRQYIGQGVFARIGAGTPEIQVVLKDISNTGFAFIYREEIENYQRSMVLVQYEYRDEVESFNLTLSGRVVRKQQLEDGRFLYGCVLVKKNDLISKFVTYKQKEQLSRINQTLGAKNKK